MQTRPAHQEIDHRTIKLIVGVVAISLASLTNLFAAMPLTSISASYHEGGWSQSIFIGFLFAIAAFMLAYNGPPATGTGALGGKLLSEKVLSKIAAFAALGVALFPCECKGQTGLAALACKQSPLVPYVHAISAAVMFVILAWFCYLFLQRARAKGHAEAKRRAVIYALCGVAMVVAILVVLYDRVTGHSISSTSVPRLVFYMEATALVAFGISWLTASRALPLLANADERYVWFGDLPLEPGTPAR